MSQYIRDIDDIHKDLMEEAVAIGNENAKKAGILPLGLRNPFKIVPNGKLRMDIIHDINDYDLIEQLRPIAAQAVAEALAARPDLSVGMILGDARQGRNYFDRWPRK